MTMVDNQNQQGSSGGTDIVVALQGIRAQVQAGNAQLALILTAIQAVFPRIMGTFTLAAAATTTVAQSSVKTNAVVIPFPTNAAAATLMGSAKALYLSAIVGGTSFTVATASGGAAAGTETFGYIVVNPS